VAPLPGTAVESAADTANAIAAAGPPSTAPPVTGAEGEADTARSTAALPPRTDDVDEAVSTFRGTAPPSAEEPADRVRPEAAEPRHAERTGQGQSPSSAAVPPIPREPASRRPRGERRTAEKRRLEDIVAGCARLVLSGRGLDAVEALAPCMSDAALEAQSGGSFTPTALWTVFGLAHVHGGRPDDARQAFRTAGRLAEVAPANATCPAPLAQLAVSAARQLLDHADRQSAEGGAPDEPDLALGVSRLAIAWLGHRLASAPDDASAAALVELARELTTELHARAATRLIDQADFAGACRHVQHAVESGELSTDRAQALLEVTAVPLRSRVDRLTSAAIRGSKDEARAEAELGQAETLLDSIPERPVALPHRSAMARRIWLAYSKLGYRRLGAGELDGAADALFRALAMKGVGRRRQVRDALVRALEAMGDQRVGTVTALLARGDRAGAARVVAGVEAAIDRARVEGVPPEELEVASAKLQQLADRLDGETASR
jgi:hypothetical protein